jgi:hypothetical protein
VNIVCPLSVPHTLNDGVNTFKRFSYESGMNTHEFLHCYVRFIADKTKYMFMSRDQTAGRCHSMKIDNSCSESREEFKHLGMTRP